jgi:hypothetical protein
MLLFRVVLIAQSGAEDIAGQSNGLSFPAAARLLAHTGGHIPDILDGLTKHHSAHAQRVTRGFWHGCF